MDNNDDDFQLIRASDFDSIRVEIGMRNTTTKTAVPGTVTIQLLQLDHKGLVLDVPSRSCARGHNLVLDLRLHSPGDDPYGFDATAKVEEAVAIAEGERLQVTVSLLQFDEDGWAEFCRRFDSRQQEINRFLAAARGL